MSLPDDNQRREKHIPSLDGWRAIAILLVLISHAAYTRGFPEKAFPWWDNVFQGNLGVRLFFVISGFLITYLLLCEADRNAKISLKNFYCRRVLRIFPVYFLYLGTLAALSLAGLYEDSPSSWLGSLAFTRNMIGQGKSASVHLWSLAVEEQFYLVWPVCLFFLSLWNHPKTAAALLLLVVIACPFLRSISVQPDTTTVWYMRALGPSSILMYADSLAVGCLGAFVYRRKPLQLSARLYSILLGSTLLVVVMLTRPELCQACHLPYVFVPGIQAVVMMLAIYASIENRSGLIYIFLNSAPMVWIGVLSYSIYIWHFLFLSHFFGPHSNGSILYDWRVWWLPALGSATLSYYLVEKPVLRFKSRFQI